MTRDQVYNSALSYFKGDQLAASVWTDKYALKDKESVYYEATPDDMHRRLAKEFARIEKKYKNPMSEEEIYQLLKDFKYVVPQGSPMAGVGNNFVNISLSNCFVIGNNKAADSYGSIHRTDEEQVQIMKRRGGVGHDLSHLRPHGSYANNAKLSGLSGSAAYAERYSNSTKEVSQGGRRGALMLTMHIKHPDCERFIDSKLESDKITGANISVKITDEFMRAVKNDEDFTQTFPIDLKPYDSCLVGFDSDYESLEYDKLYSLGGGCYAKKVKAKKIWSKIITNAWKSAEPGVLFWDKVISESPADFYWPTVSTNPCGELPLTPYDSCRLLLLNLYSFVDHPFSTPKLDSVKLFDVAYKAQRLMDDIVDLEIEKIDNIIKKIKSDPEDDDIKTVELNLWNKIKDKALMGRRTGLGVTAEGDMIAAMGLIYGSDEAIKLSEQVHRTIAHASYVSSIDMAEERGAFPVFSHEETSDFLTRIIGELNSNDLHKYKTYGRRNIANLTIAPAGSVSILTQTTSGVEPAFMVSYKRRRRTEDKNKATFTDDHGEMFEDFFVFHHKFEEWYNKNWFKHCGVQAFDIDYKKPLEDFSETEISKLISKSPYHNSTANEMDWVSKVKLQGAVQKWVDHSISATTNIPKQTTIQTVSEIYMAAWKSGCKGMTIYRDGSRSGILVGVDDNSEDIKYMDAIKRPKELQCDIYHKTSLKKNWMILVGLYKGKPYEIFAFPELDNSKFPVKIDKGTITKVKSKCYKLTGKDGDKQYEVSNFIDIIGEEGQVLTRKFSMMLRHRIDPKWIIREIEEFSIITSFDKVIQRVLKNYVKDLNLGKCEVCGAELRNEGGCSVCPDCGFSKCN